MKVVFLDTVHSILKERLLAHGFTCIDGTILNYYDVHRITDRWNYN